MRTFLLKLEKAGGDARHIQFDSLDTGAVFTLLEREKAVNEATLWEGDRKVATIVRSENDYWQISRQA